MLALVTLAHALGALSVLAVAPLAPFLLESLQLTRAQVGLLRAGRLSRRRADGAAGGLADRPRSACARRSALGQLVIGSGVAARRRPRGAWPPAWPACVLAGFGFSVLNPSTGKAVVDWFPPRRRGVAMGIKQTGLTLGGLAGALTLPPLALTHGWRYALAAAGVLSLVSAVLVALVYRSPATLVPHAPGRARPPRGAWRSSCAAPACSSCSAPGWRSRSHSPRCSPTWRSTRATPSRSPRWRPASSWRWPRSAAPAAGSRGAPSAIDSSAAGAVPASSSTR